MAKAKEKAKKIVIPTIVYRENVNYLWKSIALVNAYIHCTYGDDENVVICNNSKLNDSAFRCTDKLHLLYAGTSILA